MSSLANVGCSNTWDHYIFICTFLHIQIRNNDNLPEKDYNQVMGWVGLEGMSGRSEVHTPWNILSQGISAGILSIEMCY